ncbi:hypothetical protein MMAD_28970 [Mycolicibacterium madagascariense]|uniref:DUF2993 domain-containing protein n=1 Tax=Mycolicibacterium madagascariense TaxID=212765 RepID=A0A7I7XHA0_9MYCO|nr:DUF2993 domain-containing protein [Mycolicibacterium madagascariense]BBZ28602.1 hypothetical protein MMAD_28970 [Mycolicibacterium madagascariense]
MTTPPRGPRRPGEPIRPDATTRRIPRQRPPDPPTQRIRAAQSPADTGATERIAVPQRSLGPMPGPLPQAAPPNASPPPAVRTRNRAWLRQPRSLALIALIVVAAIVGGLAGAELYARHRADSLLVAVAECVVKDGATVSFGVNPPFLWQHVTGHYTNISVVTAGHQVQDAKGMTADVTVSDVRLQGSANSKGTIGALDATLTWTAAGIKDTVAANLPGVGNLVTGVTTDPAAGTLNLEAGSITVSAKPVVTNGDLALQVQSVTGPLAQDTVQTALNGLTDKLNAQYPLGIHADSVEVTADGVVGTFSTRDASIPTADSNACFARL